MAIETRFEVKNNVCIYIYICVWIQKVGNLEIWGTVMIMIIYVWLVVLTILKNISQLGRIIRYIMGK